MRQRYKLEHEFFSFVGRSFQYGEFYEVIKNLDDTCDLLLHHMDRPGGGVYHNDMVASIDNTSGSSRS